MSKGSRKEIQWHELAHHLEVSTTGALIGAISWRNNRATGEPAPLREIAKDDSYEPYEEAVPDNFITPYVGKLYGTSATEVISTGLEQLAWRMGTLDLAKKDPDHLKFIIKTVLKK